MTEEKETERTQLYNNFNVFIKQIDLIDICIQSSQFENMGCEELPNTNRVSQTTKTWYENKNERSEFYAFQQYNVSIKDIKRDSRKSIAKLSVTFRVSYSSKIPMSDEFFGIFRESNLPLNTWPYFREFTHNSFARMGWTKIIAPAYKIQPIRNL
jgi:hypothetical protein